jgi:hypothetical protein
VPLELEAESFVVSQLPLEVSSLQAAQQVTPESQCLAAPHKDAFEQDCGTEESPPPHWMTGWRRKGTSRD